MQRNISTRVAVNFRWLLAATLLAWGSWAVRAHEDHEGEHEHQPPRRVDDKEIYKPTPLPDRINLTWIGDPAHSQAVTWRTDESVTEAVAEIAEAEPGPKFASKAARVAASTQKLESDAGPAHYHTVHFENLKPKTKYAYRLGDKVNWSEWFQFMTASDQVEPFSFVYFGDAQNDVRMHWSRVIREAFTDAPKARFMIHAGDLINNANRDSEWGEWFAAGSWLNAMIPNVPTPGNHEYGRDGLLRKLSRHWRPQFALPEEGPPGLEETVYKLDYQGVRIISLNSNERHAEQVEWLDSVLADNPNGWTVITFHHPVYSTARGRDNPHIRRLWKPVFDKHRVDLVLQGHDHTYSRVGPDVPDQVRNVPTGASVQTVEAGTVYVVSVSGPKMYRLEREPYMKRAAEGVQLYQIIHVDGDRLRYEARTADGQLYDAFSLVKRPDAPNQLIDEAPEIPEFGGEQADKKAETKDSAAESRGQPEPVGAASGEVVD
jgi:3',5'-cyclic AMP phosphodiesterase CpdA